MVSKRAWNNKAFLMQNVLHSYHAAHYKITTKTQKHKEIPPP